MHKRTLVASLALAVGIIAWAVVNLANGWVGFAMIVPVGFRGGGEMAISVARLFAALVLILIVADGIGERLRWVAFGFLVLGLGQLIFGYVEPILLDARDVNRSLYEMTFARTLAAALIVAGLLPREPPRFTIRIAAGVAVLCAVCVAGYWAFSMLDLIPQLVEIGSLEEAVRHRIAPLSWMTGWHWLFAIPEFTLAVVAAIGGLARNRNGDIGGWLPIAMILLAGSELHDVLWPSAYDNSAIFNTADALRLSMAAVVVVGGALELRRIASERAALLTAEQERVQRLQELATLKADFTTMVAHELGHPLSAIRRLTEMLSREGLDPRLRKHALTTIIRETDALDKLVTDVQATAIVERDDFAAELRPVPVGDLIHDAAVSAEAHAPDQPLETSLEGIDPDTSVLADPDRIGQVLRNLLCMPTNTRRKGRASRCEPRPTATGACVSKWPTVARASTRTICRSSSRSLGAAGMGRTGRYRAPAWGCISAGASCAPTAPTSKCAPNRALEPSSRLIWKLSTRRLWGSQCDPHTAHRRPCFDSRAAGLHAGARA